MHAIGVCGKGDIDTIVDYQHGPVTRAEIAQAKRKLIQLARLQVLLAQLQRDAVAESRGGCGTQRRLAYRDKSAVSRRELAIGYQVEPERSAVLTVQVL